MPEMPQRTTSLLTRASSVTPESSAKNLLHNLDRNREDRLQIRASMTSMNSLTNRKYWDLQDMLYDLTGLGSKIGFEIKRAEYIDREISKDEFEKAKTQYEHEAVSLEAHLVISADSKNAARTQLIDGARLDKSYNEQDHNCAWVEMLLKALDQPEQRNNEDQSEFQRNLIAAYNARNPENDTELWCPVLKRYGDADTRIASHLFPSKLGQKVTNILFGEESQEEIFSVRNGLILHSQIEKKFDKYQLVIVPTGSGQQHPIQNWKIQLIGTALAKTTVEGLGIPFSQLHDRPLEFKSEVRPAARILYVHYVIAILRFRKYGMKQRAAIPAREVGWATPGKYIRKKLLMALIEEMGDDVDEGNVQELEAHAIGDEQKPSEEDTAAAMLVLRETKDEL